MSVVPLPPGPRRLSRQEQELATRVVRWLLSGLEAEQLRMMVARDRSLWRDWLRDGDRAWAVQLGAQQRALIQGFNADKVMEALALTRPDLHQELRRFRRGSESSWLERQVREIQAALR